MPDVVYRIPGRSIVAGEYHGIDGFADILTRLRNDSGGTIELTPHEGCRRQVAAFDSGTAEVETFERQATKIPRVERLAHGGHR